MTPEAQKTMAVNWETAQGNVVVFNYTVGAAKRGFQDVAVIDNDKIMEVMAGWHEAGHLPHWMNNNKLAAFRKVLVSAGILGIESKHVPPRESGKGKAASYRPNEKGYGREEWARAKREQAEHDIGWALRPIERRHTANRGKARRHEQ